MAFQSLLFLVLSPNAAVFIFLTCKSHCFTFQPKTIEYCVPIVFPSQGQVPQFIIQRSLSVVYSFPIHRSQPQFHHFTVPSIHLICSHLTHYFSPHNYLFHWDSPKPYLLFLSLLGHVFIYRFVSFFFTEPFETKLQTWYITFKYFSCIS